MFRFNSSITCCRSFFCSYGSCKRLTCLPNVFHSPFMLRAQLFRLTNYSSTSWLSKGDIRWTVEVRYRCIFSELRSSWRRRKAQGSVHPVWGCGRRQMASQVGLYVILHVTRLLNNNGRCVIGGGTGQGHVNHLVTNIHLECTFWPWVSLESIANILNSPQKGKKMLAVFGAARSQETFLVGRLAVCVCDPGTSYFAALKIKVPGFHVVVHAPFELMASP